jgi:predicted dehydrogenase
LDLSEFKGLSLYTSDALAEAIINEALELVIVSSPDYTHYSHLVTILQAGANSVVEKPVVLDPIEGDKLTSLARSSGLKVQVAHNFRMLNVHIELKKLLEDNVIGKVNQIDFSSSIAARHGASYFRRWHRKLENSGGIFVTKGCHHYDLINWWLDLKPMKVFAVAALNYYSAGRFVPGEPPTIVKADADIKDTMSSIVCYESGVHAKYSITAFSDRTQNDIKIFGEKGVLGLKYDRYSNDPHEIKINLYDEKPQSHFIEREVGAHSGADARTLRMLFPDGNGTVNGTSISLPTLAESVLAVRIGSAINRSICSGLVEDIF